MAGRAMGGAGKMAAGQLARIILQILSLVVLARMLGPEEYGLVAMVTAIVAVAEVLRDFGLTFASIQSREMSDGLRSNLFWVNAAAGLGAASLVALAAWPIAWMYGDERLVLITLALAPMYLLNGLAAQFQADLNRSMSFGRLVVCDVVAGLTSLLLAITAAAVGVGYWALVIQQVSQALLILVISAYFARWFPAGYNRKISIRSQLSFGIDILISQVINFASRNADTIIIGLRLDASSVGIYDRAFQLFNVPISRINQPATRVALPVLARLQDEPSEFKRFVLKGQLGLMHPVMFVMSLGIAFGSMLVPLALGEQWSDAGLPFQLLCIAGLAQAANYAIYWCYLATGTVRENVKLMLVWRPITILLLLGGSYWGVPGVAAAFAFGQVGGWLLQIWWAKRVPQAPRRELVLAGLRGWALYLVPALVASAVVSSLPAASGVLAGIAAYIVAFSAILLVPSIRGDVMASMRIAGGVVRRTLRRNGR